jgi:ATP-dependent DNA helicase RecQ
LIFKDNVLYDANTDIAIAKLSKKMQETLTEWLNRGYQVKTAYVRFVVAWKSKEAPSREPETAVLLADLVLSHSEKKV